MGAWQKELDRILEQSQKNRKVTSDKQAEYQGLVDASQAFIGAYAKAAPQLEKSLSTLLDLAEEAARAAGELMVYEDELEAAKSAGDKAEVKKIEAKMKPLIATFESVKKEGLKTSEECNKKLDELDALRDAAKAAAL
jgi:hypothetical protein